MTQAFVLSQKSLSKLDGVHPDLVRVVKRAIKLTEIDFRVTEGLRTTARQKQLVAAGASKTMRSRHLTGHAVDVVAMLGAEVRWDFGLYLKIAAAFRSAAIEQGTEIRWGACWQEINTLRSLPQAVTDYAVSARASGKKPLIDGPHFELSPRTYPP